MMFILRAIFWLCVVSAFMPDRDGEKIDVQAATAEMVGAATDYCTANAGQCVGTAMAAAGALRIPGEFVLRAQDYVAAGSPAPAAPRVAVPQPRPRPVSF